MTNFLLLTVFVFSFCFLIHKIIYMFFIIIFKKCKFKKYKNIKIDLFKLKNFKELKKEIFKFNIAHFNNIDVNKIIYQIKFAFPKIYSHVDFHLLKKSGLKLDKPFYIIKLKDVNYELIKNLYIANLIQPFYLILFVSTYNICVSFIKKLFNENVKIFFEQDISKCLRQLIFNLNINNSNFAKVCYWNKNKPYQLLLNNKEITFHNKMYRNLFLTNYIEFDNNKKHYFNATTLDNNYYILTSQNLTFNNKKNYTKLIKNKFQLNSFYNINKNYNKLKFASNILNLKYKFSYLCKLNKNLIKSKKIKINLKILIKNNMFDYFYVKKVDDYYHVFSILNNLNLYFYSSQKLNKVELSKILNSYDLIINCEFFYDKNTFFSFGKSLNELKDVVNLSFQNFQIYLLDSLKQKFNFQIISNNKLLNFYVNNLLPNKMIISNVNNLSFKSFNQTFDFETVYSSINKKYFNLMEIINLFKLKKISAEQTYYYIKNSFFLQSKDGYIYLQKNECKNYLLQIYFDKEKKQIQTKEGEQTCVNFDGINYYNCQTIPYNLLKKQNRFLVVLE